MTPAALRTLLARLDYLPSQVAEATGYTADAVRAMLRGDRDVAPRLVTAAAVMSPLLLLGMPPSCIAPAPIPAANVRPETKLGEPKL
jgi:hypothetical protein